MGNITILDLLGAALIAGFLLVMVHHSGARMNETLFTTGNDLVVQEGLVSVVETLEKDIRRVGYCRDQIRIPDQSKAMIGADRSTVSFLTDVDSDGNVDTLSYYTGTTAGLSGTPNPRDMMLFREVNGKNSYGMNIGLTKFELKYYDVNGDSLKTPVADPTLIHNMEISLQLENAYPYDTIYSFAAWRQMRLRTRNLSHR
ncbi:MAG TPA: hypothetical protein VJO14_00555 [Bacteroidota bacterium]|nr:hypothetical protein [Bacteroidota bacterium]